MSKKHKHAEIIKAWADGAQIQVSHSGIWYDIDEPMWNDDCYRIKPEPDPDIVLFSIARPIAEINGIKRAIVSDGYPVAAGCNLKLTYDGETLALKHAEVV